MKRGQPVHLILLVICSIEIKAIPEGEGRQHHDDHAELQSEEVSPLHLSVTKKKSKNIYNNTVSIRLSNEHSSICHAYFTYQAYVQLHPKWSLAL